MQTMNFDTSINYTLRTLLLMFIASYSVLACGAEKNSAPPAVNQPRPADYKFAVAEADQLVKEFIAEIAHDQCVSNESEPSCTTTRQFSDGHFAMSKHSNEPVLIVEYDIDDFLATTRYRRRVQQFYVVKNGRIVTKNPTVELPRMMAKLLDRIEAFDYLPAHGLNGLADSILASYPDLGAAHSNHNTPIFEIIMEYNPKTPVVLLEGFSELDGLLDEQVICQGSSWRRKKNHITNRIAQFKDDLAKLLKSENIHYINMSFGMSHETTAKSLDNLCSRLNYSEKTKLIDFIHNEFSAVFRLMHDSKGVLSVQSSPYSQQDNGPYDCQINYSNRIMAGAFNAPNVVLPQSGLENVFGSIKKLGLCPDVWVNFNFDLTRDIDTPQTLMASLGMGIGMGRIGRESSISTSNAAPLVLSQLINIRHSLDFQDQAFTDALIQELKSALTPSVCGYTKNKTCRFQDPLRYRRTEIHRLGYW